MAGIGRLAAVTTEHYSPKRFFRDVPAHLLARYFKQKTLLADFNFASLFEAEIDPLYTAWEALAENQKIDSEQDFKEIDALACEGGIRAILDDAEWYGEEDVLLAGMRSLKSFHEKAFWIFLEHQKYWFAANAFFHADSIRLRFWRKRINLPKSPARVDSESVQALEKNLVNFFHDREGRGKNCKVDCYKRGALDYFFAYPEDYPQARMVWHKQSLQRQLETPAFEIIFNFNPGLGTLELYLDGTRKVIPELQTIFAGAILDFELTEDEQSNRVYDLAPLKSANMVFKYCADSGITNVAVKKLRMKILGTNQKMTMEADTTNNRLAIYEMMESLNKSFPVSSMVISQVGLVVTFAPAANRNKPKTRTFDISWPNSCSLKYDDNDIAIRKMLVDSGIEPRWPGQS
jgi:hypothetical protein